MISQDVKQSFYSASASKHFSHYYKSETKVSPAEEGVFVFYSIFNKVPHHLQYQDPNVPILSEGI